MKRAVKLTDNQMNVIESAICQALAKDGPHRAGKLERHPLVVPALSTLPAGKSDMRHIDSALQRLRRIDAIKHTSKGWKLR